MKRLTVFLFAVTLFAAEPPMALTTSTATVKYRVERSYELKHSPHPSRLFMYVELATANRTTESFDVMVSYRKPDGSLGVKTQTVPAPPREASVAHTLAVFWIDADCKYTTLSVREVPAVVTFEIEEPHS